MILSVYSTLLGISHLVSVKKFTDKIKLFNENQNLRFVAPINAMLDPQEQRCASRTSMFRCLEIYTICNQTELKIYAHRAKGTYYLGQVVNQNFNMESL